MRATDRALPAVVLDVLDPAGAVAGWPFRPVIALANNAGVFKDLTCYFSKLFTDAGPIDRNGNMPASRAMVTLHDPRRDLARYTADLKLTDWAAGNELVIWCQDPAVSWTAPLFRGRINRFDDLGRDVIEIEAFDAVRPLADSIVTPYTAGVAGDTVQARLAALVALTLVTEPTSFQYGTLAGGLSAQPSSAKPIDEIRAVAQSDGGVFFSDADGTIRYLNRSYRGGRTDQVTVPRVSDNVCSELQAWNVETTTNDVGQADVVKLANVGGLVATATRVAPPALRNLITAQVKQQWIDQADGDQLAAFLLRTAPAAGELALKGVTLYPLDLQQPGIAATALGARLFDRLTLVHEQPVAPTSIELPALVIGVRHEAGPDSGWTTTLTTARAVPYLKADLWDDTPTKLWDDTPLRYWSY